MRLECPNCKARYEVDDDAIQGAGRDVECSACGHAWFQVREPAGPGRDARAVDEADEAGEAGGGMGPGAPRGRRAPGASRDNPGRVEAEGIRRAAGAQGRARP